MHAWAMVPAHAAPVLSGSKYMSQVRLTPAAQFIADLLRAADAAQRRGLPAQKIALILRDVAQDVVETKSN